MGSCHDEWDALLLVLDFDHNFITDDRKYDLVTRPNRLTLPVLHVTFLKSVPAVAVDVMAGM